MRCSTFHSITVLVLLFAAHNTCGFPDGAPRNRKVCKTLRPHHQGAHAQTSSAPYVVTPEKTKIPVGGSVKVTISATSGSSYKGFVMQARPRMIYNVEYIKPVGTFAIIDEKNSKTLDCLSGEKNTVTHSNANEKTSSSFTWTPPPKYKGLAYFRASFVKDFSTYWLNVSSKIVVGDTETVEPAWIESDSTESKNEDVISLISDVYEGCGSSKSCFGVPGDCVSDRSCDALVTVIARNNKFEFELVGRDAGYVAAGLSENGDLDVNSVTKCMLMSDDTLNLHRSRYYEYQSVEHPSASNNRRTLINSSYIDGAIYCKFERDETVEFNSVEYDLKNKQYFVLLAVGKIDEGKERSFNVENIRFHSSVQKKFLWDVSGFSTANDINEKPQNVSNFGRQFVKIFINFLDYFVLT